MKTKKLTKFAFIIMAILFTSLLITGGSVQAALQSNPSVHYKKTDSIANWLTNIRKMEAAGGAMGLSETLGTNLLSTTSNNIDVHCIKSTEYGAMAILSASGYGNPNKIPTTGEGSTTGNNTGVLLNSTYSQGVAGETSGCSGFSGVDARYYDLYTNSQSSAKAGDALGTASTTNPGCAGWHSATTTKWFSSTGQRLERGVGGLFSFDYRGGGGTTYSRVVAVCGEGL